MTVLSVSQLNRYLKSMLENDKKLTDLYIRGEVSNFVCHSGSGHMYFTLKDADGAIKAVMFRRYAGDLPFAPRNGMGVLARANVGFYERDGNIQLYVTDMQPDGVGALYLAFTQLKERLASEGYFDQDRKRPIHPYPQRIGIVTSEDGAALRDILQVLERRYPIARIVLVPALVQGEGAAASIVSALDFLDRKNLCDVILLARGGGSLEDLWAFNRIEVAQAVYRCTIPVISAVGHETDYTICDFVADLRAPTPSAAAELVASSTEHISARLEDIRRQLHAIQSRRLADGRQRLDSLSSTAVSCLERKLSDGRRRLETLRGHRLLASPLGYVEKNKEKLDFFCKMLYNNICIIMQCRSQELAATAALLDSLSPLRVLGRGYALVLKGEKGVSGLSALAAGDDITLRMRDGSADATINKINRTGGCP